MKHKVHIKQYFLETPRRHLAEVCVEVDGKFVTKIDGMDCEFVSEVDNRTAAARSMARSLATALQCDVTEEISTLRVVKD